MKKILTPVNLFRISLAVIILGLIAGYCCARDFNDPSISEDINQNQKQDQMQVPPPIWDSSEVHHELQMQFCKVETHCRGWGVGIGTSRSKDGVITGHGWNSESKCKQISECQDKSSSRNQQDCPTKYIITKFSRYFICTDNNQLCKEKKEVTEEEYKKW